MTIAKTFTLLLLIGIAYVVYLDYDCGALGGAMTWEGKRCVEDLTK